MESLRERREKVIRQHMEAENRHDAVGVVKTFHRPRYDIVPMGAVNEGAQSVQELMQGLFVGFPDFRAEAVATYHADEAVIVEIKMSGTHRGVWAGIPPTGRPMTLRSIGVFAFEDDRLVGETVYFDFATLARQLGVA